MNSPTKMRKTKSDFITAVGISEVKDIHYIVSFLNDSTDREYIFLVPKLLMDAAMKDRAINDLPTESITGKEIDEEREKTQGRMHV